MKRKTLIILTPGFPQNEADTTCMPPQQVFVKALRQEFPGVHIIVMAFEYPFQKGRYNWYGCEVMAFGGKNRARLYRVSNWVLIWKQLNKINRGQQVIGLLSFWMGDCALIGRYFAKINQLRHFCWLLGQDAKAGNHYVNMVKPQASALIALSDFLAAEFNHNYGIKPAHVIPTGLDTHLFPLAEAQTRDIDLLGAGSLIPLKHYELFVHAVNHLSGYIPDIKAVICGSGPEKERLTALIKSLQMEQNITLTGELPHAEVLALMQRSKVFLHPSEYEGFGAVLLEALYAGAHVVSFVRPMDEPMPNHNVVNNIAEMNAKLLQLLGGQPLKHQKVMVYAAADIVQRMMALFAA